MNGQTVYKRLAVYGNKGSTDQCAYVQQLREGVPNFLATFIEVLEDRQGSVFEVEPGITSGDYLSGFVQGTRQAIKGVDQSLDLATLAKKADSADVESVYKIVQHLEANHRRVVLQGDRTNPYHLTVC